MYQEIYIDLVFVANLLMDYILLRIAGALLKLKAGRGRCVIAATLGAFFSCIILYIPVEQMPVVPIFLHGGCAMGMLKISYRIKQGALLAKAMLMLYMTAFLCGGIWEALAEGKGVTLKVFFIAACCTYVGTGSALLIADSVRASRKSIYPVTLVYQGRMKAAYGFYDTGNLMTDPVNGQPVSVVEPELLNDLISAELVHRLKHLKENPREMKSTEIAGLKPHFLTCKTIGQGEMLMLAVTLESLCIHTPREVVRIADPVVALAFGPHALGREYKVLINSRLLH